MGYQTTHRAVEELKQAGLMPQHPEVYGCCAYLNHIVESVVDPYPLRHTDATVEGASISLEP